MKNVALFPTKSFHSSKAILAKFLFPHLLLAHVFKCSIYVMFWSWITSVTNKLDIPFAENIPATAKFHHIMVAEISFNNNYHQDAALIVMVLSFIVTTLLEYFYFITNK